MTKSDVLDNYEELLNYTEEVRNSLLILERWLSKTHDNYDATVLREEYSALLNLATKRLDSLIFEHTTIIENAMKGN
ncbi:TPA: hypothetical protein U1266_000885 [Streptococcus suis]|uniref:Uncharacterized protein n=1 Tax=Streptococcus suis TaxID=1307 RepID=A0AAJ2UIN2_STRSU|nr:hypothetical protein [Streptococcus suis]NQJ50114.1 hypothetical protein [Streptococcus suis]NQJ52083.1 hypothetical protein [Streptococcus suis]NQJ56437.1 hypothetical protein [Streptococcus suis]NQR49552.1 hypothetical protein [Streptococcus suis]